MSVPKVCRINVEEYLKLRESDKQLTYSGYKRSKVLQSFDKDLQRKKPVGAVYWMTELILSGAFKTLLDKCIIFFMKNINISNPNMPEYILEETVFLQNLLDSYKGDVFALADNQTFRNHICEFVSILALSDKQRVENRIRCKDDQFNIQLLKEKMEASGTYLTGIWQSADERTAYIPFNEFKYHITKTYNRERAVFWISWLLDLHKRYAKKKLPFEFASRCEDVGKRHRKYFVWLVWDIILDETRERADDRLTRQIVSLYKLYKFNFGKRHITSRITYILCAILYLTQTVPAIRFTLPICNDYDVLTLMNVQINILFKGLCSRYKSVQQQIQKREFYKREFHNIICEREDQVNIFSNKRRPQPRPKPVMRPAVKPVMATQPKPKQTSEPIMDMKYFSQVDKIANFQYRRSLNI